MVVVLWMLLAFCPNDKSLHTRSAACQGSLDFALLRALLDEDDSPLRHGLNMQTSVPGMELE